MWLFLNSDPKLEAQRQRLSSVVTADLLPSLEGVELGAIGKVSVHLIFTVVMRNRKHRNAGMTHIKQLDSVSICPAQTVSYAQFLYPTNALVRQKSGGVPETCTAQTTQSGLRGNGQRSFTPARLNNSVAQEPCTTVSSLFTRPLVWLHSFSLLLCAFQTWRSW